MGWDGSIKRVGEERNLRLRNPCQTACRRREWRQDTHERVAEARDPGAEVAISLSAISHEERNSLVGRYQLKADSWRFLGSILPHDVNAMGQTTRSEPIVDIHHADTRRARIQHR